MFENMNYTSHTTFETTNRGVGALVRTKVEKDFYATKSGFAIFVEEAMNHISSESCPFKEFIDLLESAGGLFDNEEMASDGTEVCLSNLENSETYRRDSMNYLLDLISKYE